METNLERHQSDQDLPIEELAQLNLCEDENEEQEEEYDDEDDDDVDFSFACDGALLSPVSAEDAFHNGEIRPVFPFFGYDLEDLKERLPLTPRMKKIFVESNQDDVVPVTSSALRNDIIAAGPYCQWSEKTAEKPDLGKKSNSTGFSKLWRFKEFVHRSNSDGRDAFVFLNPPAAPPRTVVSGEKGGEVKDKVKVPQKKKKKSESVLAHERYMRSKAKDDARRRYRPDIVGLFTNVNGGLTRNVHPF